MAVMNKKGGLMLGVVIGLLIFMIGTQFVGPLQDLITEKRADLTCTGTGHNLTNGNKALCLILDVNIPYFILGMFAVVFGFLGRYL